MTSKEENSGIPEKEEKAKREKKHELYLKQKALLDTFLEKHAITQKQYDKSLHDLTEKMGETRPEE